MDILIDQVPKSVEVDGEKYPVNFGFRTFILIEGALFDSSLTDTQKVNTVLRLFFKDAWPKDLMKAWEAFLWFYRCGRVQEENKKKKTRYGRPQENNGRSYDFQEDAGYIYAAFLTQYRIDLQDLPGEELHWWKFRAMFESLNEDLKISKIMHYRSADTSGMSSEQKQFYNRMKALYRLGNSAAVDDKAKLAKRNADFRAHIVRIHEVATHAT